MAMRGRVTARAVRHREKAERMRALEAAGGLKTAPLSEDERTERQRHGTKNLSIAYEAVDERDKFISWVSGTELSARQTAPYRKRVVRHHMARRSLAKGRINDPFNIITVSPLEADLLDTHQLIPVDAAGDEVFDTRQIVRFAWNRALVPVGKEPRHVTVLERAVPRQEKV